MNNYNRAIYLFLCFSLIPILVQSQCTSFPVVNLGNDTSVCDVTFTLDAGNPGMDFLWNTSDTTQQLNASSTGQYAVTVTDSLGCSSGDTINLVFNPPSVAGIISLAGGDTILCGNEPTLFYSIGHTGYVLWWVMDTINWVWAPFGSGDTLDYGPSPNNLSGVYTIMATATNGNCPADTANVLNIALHSSPEVDLGPDVSMCGGGLFLYSNYPSEHNLWSTGDTIYFIGAISSGSYWNLVTFQNGCSDSDTMNLVLNSYPNVTWNFPIDTMCTTDQPVQLTGGSPVGGSYSGWNVSNGYFDPSQGGGAVQIVYVWTDSSTGCTNSAVETIYTDTCVGILEWMSANAFVVYPNPANQTITVELSPLETTIEILNMNGQVVMTFYNTYRNGEIAIDISNLPNGIYFVRASNETSLRYSRFVKQL